MKIRILCFLLIISNIAAAQSVLPPMAIPFRLSGNFGELRSGHLHSGVDIKTGGVTGIPVVSIADGYVTRIFVSPYGYGLALYINHPDGRMSVYGHLDRFNPEIEKWVREQQYKRTAYSVDLYPDRDKFPLKAGDLIAYSGNSGASGGPHLHFELRNSANSKLINPITTGAITVKDHIPPRFMKMYIVEINVVNGIPVHKVVRTLAADTVTTNTVLPLRKNSYFALEVTEAKNDNYNVLGVYRTTGFMDDSVYYRTQVDGFEFSQTRYVNAYVLYEQHMRTKYDVIRTFKAPNNKLPIYETIVNQGVINLQDTLTHKIEFMIEDDCGNACCLDFMIVRDTTLSADSVEAPKGLPVYWNRTFKHRIGAMELTIPAGSLYESTFIEIGESTPIVGSLSGAYTVGASNIPLQNSITVSIDAEHVADSLHKKLVVAGVNAKTGKLYSMGGAFRQGRMELKTRSMGTYCIAADTLPPTIKPLFDAKKAVKNRLEFTIADEFSGVASYKVMIDDTWELFAYDTKQSRIIHTFATPASTTPVKHKVVVTVRDGRDNLTRYEGEFLR